jgi:hypothetical protein
MLIFMLGNTLEVGGIFQKKVPFGGHFEGVDPLMLSMWPNKLKMVEEK